MSAAEAQPPAEGLSTVATLRRRLEMLEALHVERAIQAGWSWRQVANALGVTKQAAHKKHARRIVERLAGEGIAGPKKLVVTGRARQSVRLARQEAQALGEPAVRPEHLLLGLLRGDEGPVVEALDAVGLSLETVRQRVRTSRAPANGNGTPRRAAGEPLPVAPAARAAMEESLREAVRRRDAHLGAEHLLLALLHDEQGPAVRLLCDLGVRPEALERTLDEALSPGD